MSELVDLPERHGRHAVPMRDWIAAVLSLGAVDDYYDAEEIVLVGLRHRQPDVYSDVKNAMNRGKAQRASQRANGRPAAIYTKNQTAEAVRSMKRSLARLG